MPVSCNEVPASYSVCIVNNGSPDIVSLSFQAVIPRFEPAGLDRHVVCAPGVRLFLRRMTTSVAELGMSSRAFEQMHMHSTSSR
jgi:hypothetical protein